ncbi:MAG: hypothetical protein LBN30_04875 [Oscillospiraceae bacterium]|jgi:hypothetical protein|nr:hypothetical protein [Oscillospiraceae bacterium]
MKIKIALLIAVLTALALPTHAAAAFIPDSEVAENRDGRQQIVRTYSLAPEENPDALISEPFAREGFAYTFASITKSEQQFSDKKLQSETVTVNTAKGELGAVLEVLAPTLAYDGGGYSGTLALDHTSIVTEVTGYTTVHYTVTDTKTYDNLDRNDPSYVPQTTVKDGRTLTLADISWSAQGSGLADDALVPTLYMAVATYSGNASSKTADGYVTTATYSGEISASGVKAILYTVTYLGEPILAAVAEVKPSGIPGWVAVVAIGVAVIALGCALTAAVLLKQEKRRYNELWSDYWLGLDVPEATDVEVVE